MSCKFNTCGEVDTTFIEAEQAITDDIIKYKMVAKNAYYGKIDDSGSFPLNSGTRIKGYRLGRVGVPNCIGWRPIVDERCQTNLCNPEEDGVIQHGHEFYFYSLVEQRLRSDWICLDSLLFREISEDEITHYEDGLKKAARYVHEEFRRSRYLHFGANKMVPVLPRDAHGNPCDPCRVDCADQIRTDGWMFEYRQNGEIDECHVRVRVHPNDIPNISELSLDMLDDASYALGYEHDKFMNDYGLFDVLLADKRQARKLALLENDSVSGGNFHADFIDLRQNIGTEKVLRDYSLRTDIGAMRFYPDTQFNTTQLPQQGPFDIDNPQTWPRFVRVFPYKPVKPLQDQGDGLIWRPDPMYRRAPFGIVTILMNDVIMVQGFPYVGRVGGASKTGDRFGYDGSVQWHNIQDNDCNPDGDKGYWKMRFRMAAKQSMPELGYSWFVRIDTIMGLVKNYCPVPNPACIEEATSYCYFNTGVDFPGENRVMNLYGNK